MNYTTAVFLINNQVRAVYATYEDGEKAPRTLYKTLDTTINVGDFCIVPTETRHKMTVVKIVEVDVDVDFDSSTQVSWIIGKVDMTAYQQTIAQEQTAITAIKSAELRKKREGVRDALFANHLETLKSLPIANMEDSNAKPDLVPLNS